MASAVANQGWRNSDSGQGWSRNYGTGYNVDVSAALSEQPVLSSHGTSPAGEEGEERRRPFLPC